MVVEGPGMTLREVVRRRCKYHAPAKVYANSSGSLRTGRSGGATPGGMDEEASRRREAEGVATAPLPPERAFVVQLRAPTDPTGELFVGRAEHLASGAAERFGCAAELLAFMAKVLAPPAPVGGEGSASAPTGEPIEDLPTSSRRTTR